jgi:hypothetical protein
VKTDVNRSLFRSVREGVCGCREEQIICLSSVFHMEVTSHAIWKSFTRCLMVFVDTS